MSKTTHAQSQQQTIDKMTSDTLLGSLMQLVHQELVVMQKPWQAMTEEEQADAIHRIEMSLRQAVTKATKLLASDDRANAMATLEQLVLKDGIKAVLKLPKDTGSTQFLADAVGKSVLVVFIDADAHMSGADAVQPDPNQRALIGEGGNATH
ncbi:MAG TPA: hypothetical protein VGH91_04700 [Gammaproteobacteria bacterium]|jgi:phage/plasmid primase-like uncharacterized protein